MKIYNVKVNGNDYSVSIDSVDEKNATVSVNGTNFSVELESNILVSNAQPVARPVHVPAPGAVAPVTTSVVATPRPSSGVASGIMSPLPGAILEVFVKEGDTVKEGQKLLILEAMKMENNIESDKAGVVTKVAVSKGSSVMEGDLLITIE